MGADQVELFLPLQPQGADADEPDAPRRMITDETETELREQLSQLMGPEIAIDDALMDNTTLAEVGT